jgi:uncharacterized membrane protein YfcA
VSGVSEAVVLLLAGLLAGVVGSAGGITSLVSYPALLAVGLPPFAANVTNSVALLGSGAGAASRARPDVDGHSRTLRVWMPPVVVLSAVGACLLLRTPTHVFDVVVPFLVAIGSTILLLQPAISRWQLRRNVVTPRVVIVLTGAAVSVYNGYFGAGSGILLIAVLALTTEPVLHRANALKNVILLAADLIPALLFALSGSVVWSAMWPLAVGALVGGLIGPTVARRTRPEILRPLVAACGYVLAVWLLLGR